jgi:SAM-dependent methyltransferase
MIRLNLGAGGLQPDGYVHVDIVALPGVDVVHNLDEAPWPWGDGEVEVILAYDIFEHINDPLVFMRECGRVLAPGGRLHLRTTWWQSENAYTDPTHKRFCTQHTFDYWVPGTEIGDRYGAAYAQGVAFAKEKWLLDGQELVITLRRL